MRCQIRPEEHGFALIECTIATAVSALFLGSLFLLNSSAMDTIQMARESACASQVLQHQRYVQGKPGGKRAELRFVNLSGLRFPKINLSGAVLTGINLSRSALHDADIEVMLGRQVEPVAGELHAIDGESLLTARIARKRDGVAVAEGPRFGADLHRHGRSALRLDAQHPHGLEIGARIASGCDAPDAQMLGDVASGQSQSRAEHRAPLQIVGRDVGQPLPEVIRRDRRSPRRGRRTLASRPLHVRYAYGDVIQGHSFKGGTSAESCFRYRS